MKQVLSSSSCIRCGKQRIVTKTYTETINNSTVTFEDCSCPDPECQKKVDGQLKTEQEKREKTKNDNEKSAKDRLERIKNHQVEEEN